MVLLYVPKNYLKTGGGCCVERLTTWLPPGWSGGQDSNLRILVPKRIIAVRPQGGSKKQGAYI